MPFVVRILLRVVRQHLSNPIKTILFPVIRNDVCWLGCDIASTKINDTSSLNNDVELGLQLWELGL